MVTAVTAIQVNAVKLGSGDCTQIHLAVGPVQEGVWSRAAQKGWETSQP